MKKNLSIILSFVLLLTLFAGCSAPDYQNEAEIPREEDGATDVTGAEEPAAEYDMAEGGWAGEYEAVEEIAPGESYLTIDENRATSVEQESVITLSLKVDTAAYNNVERYLQSGNLPPKDAVRTEELINYFSYDAEMRYGDDPFALYTEVGPSPFDDNKYMAFVRVATESIDRSELPRSNLVFLIDTSGSMDSYDKLPLLKEAFSLLVETLDESDRVSIVTYAGNSAVVLDSVSGADKDTLLTAIQRLDAGGSTAGADGIRTAYALAEKNYMADGNNRVILATDGDYNVGISNTGDLEKFISEKRDTGVYLSVLGFGTGNIRDDIMETLSMHGNGNYSYINSVQTARKVLVEELASNLFVVAEDVKAQVEFNPASVSNYRLIGYENRQMRNEDFLDDTKDAGEIGAGTDVVMLFEIELQGSGSNVERKYDTEEPAEAPAYSDELFEVRIAYKNPGQSENRYMIQPILFSDIGRGGSDFRFATAVAAFGHLLRDSEYLGQATIDSIYAQAQDSLGVDPNGYRRSFLSLLDQYRIAR